MEIEQLLARWQVLSDEPGGVIAPRSVLQERLDILHRLNELGIKDIEGLSIFALLETANASMREIDRATPAQTHSP